MNAKHRKTGFPQEKPSNEKSHPDFTDDGLLDAFAGLRVRAPAGFGERVMRAVSASRAAPGPRFQAWPTGWSWVAPALSGAVAAALIIFFLTASTPFRAPTGETITVQFAFHAPHAEQVELVGDFTEWQPGRILLSGPDESGHWTTRITLPAGRHEYLFLVDGREWVTDPRAPARRPDGFGNLNAVLNL